MVPRTGSVIDQKSESVTLIMHPGQRTICPWPNQYPITQLPLIWSRGRRSRLKVTLFHLIPLTGPPEALPNFCLCLQTNSAKNLIPLTGPPEALPNFCFCPWKNSGNFLRKEPHIAYRGRSRSFEADLEADLEAEIEAAKADLEATEAA